MECVLLSAMSFRLLNGYSMFEMVNLTKRTAVTAEYKTTPHKSADKIIILPDILRSFKSKPETDISIFFRM